MLVWNALNQILVYFPSITYQIHYASTYQRFYILSMQVFQKLYHISKKKSAIFSSINALSKNDKHQISINYTSLT